MAGDRFITPKQALAMSGLREGAMTELRKAGKFPQRVQISPRRWAYVEREVQEWIDVTIAARDSNVEN